MAVSSKQQCRSRWSGWWMLPVAVALCALAAAVILPGLDRRDWASWLVPAITSTQFLFSAGVLAAAAVLLIVVCRLLWQIGRPYRRARRDGQEGVAIIEFVMVFPIAAFLVMVMVQATLLMAGNLCVHYSAFCAARSAIVTIPATYANEPANSIDLTVSPPFDMANPPKMGRIRNAAVYAVMPMSCGNAEQPDQPIPLQDTVAAMFQADGQADPYWLRAQVGRKWFYADNHTKVELVVGDVKAPMQNWVAHSSTYGRDEEVVVRVSHVFYLSIPGVRRLFALGSDGVNLNLPGSSGPEYGTIIRATCRLSNEGVQDYVDVETFQ